MSLEKLRTEIKDFFNNPIPPSGEDWRWLDGVKETVKAVDEFVDFKEGHKYPYDADKELWEEIKKLLKDKKVK